MCSNDFLYHHGILGQKWGIRRFQPYPKGSSSKGKFIGKAKQTKQTKRKVIKAVKKRIRAERLAAVAVSQMYSATANEYLGYSFLNAITLGHSKKISNKVKEVKNEMNAFDKSYKELNAYIRKEAKAKNRLAKKPLSWYENKKFKDLGSEELDKLLKSVK